MRKVCLAAALFLLVPLMAGATPITLSTSTSFSSVSVSSSGSVSYTATPTSIQWDSGALLQTYGIAAQELSGSITNQVLAHLYWKSGSNTDKTYNVSAAWNVAITLAPPSDTQTPLFSVNILDKKQVNQADTLTLGGIPQTMTLDGWTIDNFKYIVDGRVLITSAVSLYDHDDEDIYLAADFTAPVPAPVGSPVPEPTSMILLGTGLIGLARAGRRRQ